jgi:two-component system nitrate/nitrite sensor histidine kinase NarX
MVQTLNSHEPPPANAEDTTGFYKIPALSALSEISTSLSSDNDLEVLLERFLRTMIRLAGAQAGAVRLVTQDGTHTRLVSAIGLPPDVLEREQLVKMPCGVCGQALQENNIRSDDELSACLAYTASDYFGSNCRKVLAIPLQHKGKVLGIYNLFMPAEREVPDEVSSLFRSISEHLGLALENARLTRENLRVTLTNERQIMASEIHDSLAQSLAYMKMRMALLEDAMVKEDKSQSLKYMADVNETLGNAYQSLRELITSFRSRMDPHGLLHALHETVRNFYDRTDIKLDFTNQAPDLHLTVDQEVQVFHIVQEALANIRKHARAQHARILLHSENGQYVVTIEDDGEGMLVNKPGSAGTAENPPHTSHFGLSIMRERAQRLEGKLEVESTVGEGTRVRLTFPATNTRRAARF